jgi:hypothetical protein
MLFGTFLRFCTESMPFMVRAVETTVEGKGGKAASEVHVNHETIKRTNFSKGGRT